ncbi:MAG: metalloregulator ArsR/SmtB family transcription factor [Nitrospiraceae bacterium]|nr:metalloregulator ArsR/SmtB family transcription factor [Nitrospiraceae bacterium]
MQDILNILKALSDKTRLRILKLLGNEELCVCDIVAALNLIQPKISFHLNILKKAGLIKDRKQGKWIHYRIDNSDMFKRFLILSVIEKIPEEAAKKDMKRLEDFLKKKSSIIEVSKIKNKIHFMERIKNA